MANPVPQEPGTPAHQPVVIDGRITRKTANALRMTFQEGGAEPFATALQSGGDGKGAKFGVLLGFKNGGPGRHTLTFDQDARRLLVHSRSSSRR